MSVHRCHRQHCDLVICRDLYGKTRNPSFERPLSLYWRDGKGKPRLRGCERVLNTLLLSGIGLYCPGHQRGRGGPRRGALASRYPLGIFLLSLKKGARDKRWLSAERGDLSPIPRSHMKVSGMMAYTCNLRTEKAETSKS